MLVNWFLVLKVFFVFVVLDSFRFFKDYFRY